MNVCDESIDYTSSKNPFVSLHNKPIEASLLYFRHIDLLTKEK